MMKNNEVDDATAIFQKPAVKLFCRQLKDCQLQCDNSNISYCLVPLKSTISGKEILHPVYLIWIQGTILSIISTSQIALKDNSNGVVKVIDCDKMPGIDTWIRKGAYCSVVGQLISSSGTPQLRAVKITPLIENSNLQPMWDWEVKDLANMFVESNL